VWWSLLVNALLLIGLGVGVWLVLREIQYRQMDDRMLISAAELARSMDIDALEVTIPQSELTELSDRGVFGWVVTSSGHVLKAFGQAESLPWPGLQAPASFHDLTLGSTEIRLYQQAPVREDSQDVEGIALVMATSREPAERTSRAILLILSVAMPLGLAVAAAGAMFLARRALAPISTITAQARRIGRANLSERLALPGPRDEVGQLADTFDDMLDRLQAAFEHERQFLADASHELRTPLGLLRMQIDLAQSRPRDAATLTAMVRAMGGDVDRMTRLVEAMLALTRLERAQTVPVPVDLYDVLSGLVSQLQPLALERQITLTLDGPAEAHVLGDRDRLVQLFLNLLDNALKYTLPGGPIGVRVQPVAATWQVAVADSGPGIPAEHLPHLFDRFYRVDTSRARATGGVGLGLAIAQTIAQQHGGAIAVASYAGQGTIFTVTLPRATRPRLLTQPLKTPIPALGPGSRQGSGYGGPGAADSESGRRGRSQENIGDRVPGDDRTE
jgi:heavy metal sensor kinase